MRCENNDDYKECHVCKESLVEAISLHNCSSRVVVVVVVVVAVVVAAAAVVVVVVAVVVALKSDVSSYTSVGTTFKCYDYTTVLYT